MKRDDAFTVVMFLVLVSYFLLGANVTAQESRPSNVTVSAYVAISLSTNLSSIEFGTQNPNTADVNGSHNWDGVDTNTSYVVSISSDSNINADLCIRDDWALNTSGGDVLGNGNYTWNDNSSGGDPALQGTAITTSFAITGVTNIAPGSDDYFRFWLDVPTGQAAGTYNNTVYIKGISTGSGC